MESKFKVGDVVNVTDDSNELYVVKESILIDDGITRKYQYEVIPLLFGSNNAIDDTYTYYESSLEFQYHDTQWEEYFTEGTRQNGLPAWRGELYNFYMFYTNFESHTGLDYKYMEEYNNNTIPPMFMRHILAEHSIYCRIDKVLESTENVRKIEERLNIDKYDMEKLVNSIKSKINTRNFRGTNKASVNVKPNKFDFTGDEMNLVAEIDKLDVVVKNGQRRIEDHYPVDMSNWQIMDAIKEAYNNAHRLGERSLKQDKDLRTGELPQPMEGYRKYEGYSSKYDITIRFLYNFDMNLITTAYPKE